MGIILDHELSNVLLASNKRKVNSDLLNEALFALLLYGNAYIPNQFANDKSGGLEKLTKENLITVIPGRYNDSEQQTVINNICAFQESIHKYKHATQPFHFTWDSDGRPWAYTKDIINRGLEIEDSISDANYFSGEDNSSLYLSKEILWEYYSRERTTKSKKYSSEELASFGIYFENFFPAGKDSTLDELIEFGTQSVKNNKSELLKDVTEYYDMMSDSITKYELIKLLKDNDISFNYKSDSKKLLKLYYKTLRDSEINLFNRVTEQLYFLRNYVKFKELTRFSLENGIPIKANLGIIRPALQTVNYFNQDSAYAVYKIMLREVEYLPRLDSIDDVLRLRGDKKLKDFRESINQWSTTIKDGTPKQLMKATLDIRKANREIRKMKSFQKVGGWITYASLPLIFVDVLTGIPAGIGLSLVGGAVQFKAERIKKLNQWVLFGNRFV